MQINALIIGGAHSRLVSQQEASQENWFNLLNRNKVMEQSCYRGCLFVYFTFLIQLQNFQVRNPSNFWVGNLENRCLWLYLVQILLFQIINLLGTSVFWSIFGALQTNWGTFGSWSFGKGCVSHNCFFGTNITSCHKVVTSIFLVLHFKWPAGNL